MGYPSGAEIDLILYRAGKLFAVEGKRSDSPRFTPSTRTARSDLGLEKIAVIYPGAKRYPIADRAEAIPLTALAGEAPIFPADAGRLVTR